MDDKLMHYGVKGMKWGVRRFQNKDGSLTAKGKERYNKKYRAEEREDGTYILKKGSEVHRVTAHPDAIRKGHAYVSFMDADVKGYKREITNWLKEDNPDIKTYDLTMKLTKDLIIPSELEKAKTYVELLMNEKVNFKPMYVLKLSYSDEQGRFVGRPRKMVDALMRQGMDNETASQYALFAMSMYTDKDNRDAFFEALQNKGYNAIEDFEDSYSHRMKPLIVFERENTLKIVKSEEIPDPYEDFKAWLKIEDDADEALRRTKAYHKNKGITQ